MKQVGPYVHIVADTKAQAIYWAKHNYDFTPTKVENIGPSRDGRRTFKCYKPLEVSHEADQQG